MKNKLTAIIVTFLRTEYFKVCIESLRNQYPDINIIVGDQSPSREKKELCEQYGAKYHELEYDCGLCTARNELVRLVETPYVLIGDDDFKYSQNANVAEMMNILETDRGIDLVGGRIMEGGTVRDYQGFINEHEGYFIYNKLNYEMARGESDKDYVKCDITFNYFVARTDKVKNTLWDEKIKVAYEHSTFFIDFKRNGYQTAYYPHAIVEHKPFIKIKEPEVYDQYKYFRARKNDKKRFFEKYKLNYVIDMNGRRDVFDGTNTSEVTFLITHYERKESLRRLLLSIVKKYPSAKILIGDQSKLFVARDYHKLWEELEKAGYKNKAKALNFPLDCGLSFARNELIKMANTRYVLILEDDFVFTEHTNINKLVDIMENERHAGIVGGCVKENNIPLEFNFYIQKRDKTFFQIADTDDWKDIGGISYKETGCTMNFFLAKRELFNTIQWDPEIKINGEHHDFFYRLQDTDYKVFYTRDVSIEHKKDLDNDIIELYEKDRTRDDFFHVLFKKHDINKIKYLNGYTIWEDGGVIFKGKKL